MKTIRLCLILIAAAVALPAMAGTQARGGMARLVLLVPNIECAQCAKAVSASLRQLDGVSAAPVSEQTKRAVVTFDPRQLTVQQLADAVAATRPLRGKPYAAGLLIQVERLTRGTTSRISAACKQVKGIARCDVVDARLGIIAVYFERLSSGAEMTGPVGVREETVMQTLRGAGVHPRLVAPEKP